MNIHISRPDQLSLLERLPAFRRDGVLCDLTLRSTDGQTFQAHKVILASASRALEILLTGPYQESLSGAPVNLEASSSTLGAFLSFLYEGRADVRENAVVPLLKFTHMYELHVIRKQLEEYVEDHLSPSLSIEILAQLEHLDIPSLHRACIRFSLQHFVDCLAAPHFVFCGSTRLLDLLEHDDLAVPSEEVVLRSIAHWLRSSPPELSHVRQREVFFLLRAVRFPLLAESTRLGMREAIQRLGALGTEISQLLAASDRLGEPPPRLRACFRGPFGKWGCAVQTGTCVAGDGTGELIVQLSRPLAFRILEEESATKVLVADTGNGRIVQWTLRGEDRTQQASAIIIAGRGSAVNGDDIRYCPLWLSADSRGRILVQTISFRECLLVVHNGNGKAWDLGSMGFPPPGVTLWYAQACPSGQVYGLLFNGDPPYVTRIVRWRYLFDDQDPEPVLQFESSAQSPPSFWVASDGAVYVVTDSGTAVRRWAPGAHRGDIVAGGNGRGGALHQLGGAANIFVTEPHYTIYIADRANHRVVSWVRGAVVGNLVAGGQGRGAEHYQLADPRDVAVDSRGAVYVLDTGNGRVMRWGPAPELDGPAFRPFIGSPG